jgi:hypothetical protein
MVLFRYRTLKPAIASVVCMVVAGALLVTPANAHTVDRDACGKHDSSQVMAHAELSDTPLVSGSPKYASGRMRTSHQWTYCGSGGGIANNINDVWMGLYVQNRYSGSWNGCWSRVPGWRGANTGFEDWYGTSTPNDTSWYSGTGSCHWGQFALRSRTIAKALFEDGHIERTWAFTPKHDKI